MTVNDLNYALVEEKRPPIYTAMKYWGKKPHNIWRKYIENYTPQNGVFLDPFAGSAISAFEGVKAGRKCIAFDLNPLTSFIIEVLSSEFDRDSFLSEVDLIISNVEQDEIYKKYFSTNCRYCGNDSAVVQSTKWNNKEIYQLGINCPKCHPKTYAADPNQSDLDNSNSMNSISITDWYPNITFHKSPSYTAGFIKKIGGNNFANIWTKRNLYVISKIFDLILQNNNEVIKKQLLLGFIKTIHLCSKMSVPRRDNAKRPFSTSWGRSAYLCSTRQMEMNPLLVFKGNCQGKQSVESALISSCEYLGKRPKLLYVDKSNKSNRSPNFDIKYGIIDINTITDFLDEKSIDFIITDPPYGGLVQYFDLSGLWLNWLQKYDSRFIIDYENEITIKKGVQDLNTYQHKFQNGINNLYRLLKPEGKIVFTFHNKDISIWNAFLNSISLAGFKIEKVIHQQNRRSGESNVANPYGTSATDFYIRCIKAPSVNLRTDEEQFEFFIVQTTIKLIAERNEPTPFEILFDGLLSEISMAGFNLDNFDQNIRKILSKHLNEIFITSENIGKAGNYWWFVNPKQYIIYPDKLLTDRVEETISQLLRRKVSVTFDDVLAEIFIKYPNGLTPDIKSIIPIIKKYANKSGGRWVYKETIEKEIRKHNEMIKNISQIGKKLGFKVFIGKKEQSETFESQPLSTFADLLSLDFLDDPVKKARIEMIDILWISENIIIFAFEIENTTNFTSGIQRASNLYPSAKRIMIIPDNRIEEFKSIKDPFFIEGFNNYEWQYMSYNEIDLIKSLRTITTNDIQSYLKSL